MIKLQTAVEMPSYPFTIDHSQRGVVLGSCFAEHIGGWLRRGRLDIELNPFGVIYNPLTIARALELLIEDHRFSRDDLFEHNGLFASDMHHGSFSHSDPDRVIEAVNESMKTGAEALVNSDYIILTLGTAWVYEREGRVVANCHKRPNREFARRKLALDEVLQSICNQIDKIDTISQKPKQWIITVSPVIHKGDGLIENQSSKSTLLLAASALSSSRANIHYFPSYEIVTSELRDYRFYDTDMCHPSPVAVEYVRERFAESLLAPSARTLITRLEPILSAVEHRPLHPEGPEYAKFRQSMFRKVEALQKEFPNVNLTRELQFFS